MEKMGTAPDYFAHSYSISSNYVLLSRNHCRKARLRGWPRKKEEKNRELSPINRGWPRKKNDEKNRELSPINPPEEERKESGAVPN